jgi:nitrate reductase NapAB chaperone NapD
MAYYGYAEERKIVWSEFRECMIDSLRDYIRSRDSGQRSVEDLDFYEEDFVALREEEHHHHQHHHAKGQPIIINNNNNNNINSHQQRGSAVAPNQPSMEEEEEKEKSSEVERTVLQEKKAGTVVVVAPRERSRAWKMELETLESVRALDPVLVIGKARLVFSRKGIRFWAQRVFLDVIYRFLYANSTSPATSLILSVPPTNLVEISMHYQI